jgi:pilus assembly protein Flp/PilA
MMKNQLQRLAAAAEGVTSIEYALIASLLAIVIITAVTGIGSSVKGMFETVAGGMP